jgi:hypothetical protein
MSSSDETPPRRVRWTWGLIGGLVLVAVVGLLLNAVYQSGHEVLALVLLAAGLVAPGVWQVRRHRPRD